MLRKCYFPYIIITGAYAETLLIKEGKPGQHLLRNSWNNPGNIVISVRNFTVIVYS